MTAPSIFSKKRRQFFQAESIKFEKSFLKRNFSSKRSCGHEKGCFDITEDKLLPKVPKFLLSSPKIGINSKRFQKEQLFSEGSSCYVNCSLDLFFVVKSATFSPGIEQTTKLTEKSLKN